MKVRTVNSLLLCAVMFLVALIGMNCFTSLLWMVAVGITLLGLAIGLFLLLTRSN